MNEKIIYISVVLVLSMFANGCAIYLKPSPNKLESYNSNSKYNFYKYYSAEFEGQIGCNSDDMIHFGLNYLDSSYWIRITNGDTIQPFEDSFRGKYSVNLRGTVFLSGDSPFLNNTYQILTHKGNKQAHFIAEFKLIEKYFSIYGKKKRGAYCEISFPYELEECLNNH